MTSVLNNRRIHVGVLLGVVTVVLGACASTQDPLSDVRGREPDPTLAPREVVEIQIQALGNNSASDEGIGIAFRFASPTNRAATGPLPRFAGMIRTAPYTVMLDYDYVDYAPLILGDGVAIQRVSLHRGTQVTVFDFVLRKQRSQACRGCWMTDGVLFRGVTRSTTGQLVLSDALNSGIFNRLS
jgi:hypothetical protein